MAVLSHTCWIFQIVGCQYTHTHIRNQYSRIHPTEPWQVKWILTTIILLVRLAFHLWEMKHASFSRALSWWRYQTAELRTFTDWSWRSSLQPDCNPSPAHATGSSGGESRWLITGGSDRHKDLTSSKLIAQKLTKEEKGDFSPRRHVANLRSDYISALAS